MLELIIKEQKKQGDQLKSLGEELKSQGKKLQSPNDRFDAAVLSLAVTAAIFIILGNAVEVLEYFGMTGVKTT